MRKLPSWKVWGNHGRDKLHILRCWHVLNKRQDVVHELRRRDYRCCDWVACVHELCCRHHRCKRWSFRMFKLCGRQVLGDDWGHKLRRHMCCRAILGSGFGGLHDMRCESDIVGGIRWLRSYNLAVDVLQ